MKIGITGASGNLGSKIFNDVSINDSNQLLPISASHFDSNRSYFDEFDLIIHAATCYGRNGESLSEMMNSNCTIPLKILENISAGQVFINVDTVLDKNVSHYSFSKGCFVDACKSLAQQGCEGKIINVKLHGFYGTNPNKRDLIYNLTSQFLQNKDVIEATAGDQKRDYIFIDDVISGIKTILGNINNFPQGFSELEIGTSKSLPMKEIMLMIKELTQSNSTINFGAIEMRKNEPMNLCANIDKMKELNWNPTVTIEDGIKKIIKTLS